MDGALEDEKKREKNRNTQCLCDIRTQRLSPFLCTPLQFSRGIQRRRLCALDFFSTTHYLLFLLMCSVNSIDFGKQNIVIIIGLMEGGKRAKGVSGEVCVSKSTAWKWCTRFWADPHENLPGTKALSGQPRKNIKTAMIVMKWELVSRLHFISFTYFFDDFLGCSEHDFVLGRFLLMSALNSAHHSHTVDLETPTCSLISLVSLPFSSKSMTITMFCLPKLMLPKVNY